jgi:hypothetical protein
MPKGPARALLLQEQDRCPSGKGWQSQGRALTAIKWYNRANSYSVDDTEAMLSLAIGFEALRGLPKEAKADRFVDAVALLGRVSRLNLWSMSCGISPTRRAFTNLFRSASSPELRRSTIAC